jgi:hypothetical protein
MALERGTNPPQNVYPAVRATLPERETGGRGEPAAWAIDLPPGITTSRSDSQLFQRCRACVCGGDGPVMGSPQTQPKLMGVNADEGTA